MLRGRKRLGGAKPHWPEGYEGGRQRDRRRLPLHTTERRYRETGSVFCDQQNAEELGPPEMPDAASPRGRRRWRVRREAKPARKTTGDYGSVTHDLQSELAQVPVPQSLTASSESSFRMLSRCDWK